MGYFHMGNPHRYDGWQYSWFAGRKLGSMTHTLTDLMDEDGNELPDVVDEKLEFVYDAAGLRTQKVRSYTDAEGRDVVETTDYTLHGKLLTHLKKTVTVDGESEGGPEQLHFYYDAAGKPIMLRLGNDEVDCAYYSYIHRLQGDKLGVIYR